MTFAEKIIKNIEIKENPLSNDGKKSIFTFKHLPSGMALPLGNFLRANLLTFTSSIAPLAVKIWNKEKVATNYDRSGIVGIDKIIPVLISDLKSIIFREKKSIPIGEKFPVELNFENNTNEELEIKAGDFEESEMVEIYNPDLVIARIQPACSLFIKILLKKGIDYKRKHEQEGELNFEDENYIPLDSDFSSVDIVNLKISEEIVNFSEKEETLNLTIEDKGRVITKNSLLEVLDSWGKIFENFKEKLKKTEENRS